MFASDDFADFDSERGQSSNPPWHLAPSHAPTPLRWAGRCPSASTRLPFNAAESWDKLVITRLNRRQR